MAISEFICKSEIKKFRLASLDLVYVSTSSIPLMLCPASVGLSELVPRGSTNAVKFLTWAESVAATSQELHEKKNELK